VAPARLLARQSSDDERQLRHEYGPATREYLQLVHRVGHHLLVGELPDQGRPDVAVAWRDTQAVSGATASRSNIPHAESHVDTDRFWEGVQLDAGLQLQSLGCLEHGSAGDRRIHLSH